MASSKHVPKLTWSVSRPERSGKHRRARMYFCINEDVTRGSDVVYIIPQIRKFHGCSACQYQKASHYRGVQNLYPVKVHTPDSPHQSASLSPSFLEQYSEVTQTATRSWRDSTQAGSCLHATSAARQSTEMGGRSPDSNSHGGVIPCTEILDLFRLVPAERELLLGEIGCKTDMDLQSPPQTPKPDDEDGYIGRVSSRSPATEPVSPTTLSDDTRQERTPFHEAFAGQHTDHWRN